MEKINLFLIDMAEGNTTSGVDRYLEMLLKGLLWYPDINVYRIQLLHSAHKMIHCQEDKGHYQQITIPLPQLMSRIVGENFWAQKYYEVVYHLIKHLFEDKTRILIHTHTLNLIDLALYIRTKVNCRIITHLHCIPWKSCYDYDKKRFNSLYKIAYHNSTSNACEQLIGTDWERRAYVESDRIICVTECGRSFVHKVLPKQHSAIEVIPNGMDDLCKQVPSRLKNDPLEFIYVGVLSESKGIFYILDAIREIKKRGYTIRLNLAGKGSQAIVNRVKHEYSDLDLNLLGNIPFNELKMYYTRSDVGIIASLQEQASYVAVEMAMFGLPIITTAVDGLDETFTDELNALKVNTHFSMLKGLTIDVGMLTNRMIELIINEDKRKKIKNESRILYENKLRAKQMLVKTVAAYQKTMKE